MRHAHQSLGPNLPQPRHLPKQTSLETFLSPTVFETRTDGCLTLNTRTPLLSFQVRVYGLRYSETLYKNPLFKNLSPYPGGIHKILVASTLRT